MKANTRFIFISIITIGLLNACGPDEAQQQQQMRERQDSLERVQQRQQRLKEQRLDSLAAARADSIARATNESGEPVFNPRAQGVTFNEKGNYAVQTGAWRSENKARQLAEEWQQRGFENAFVVKYGNEATGDVWFRVRLGKFLTEQEAQTLKTWLRENYQIQSWVTYVG